MRVKLVFVGLFGLLAACSGGSSNPFGSLASGSSNPFGSFGSGGSLGSSGSSGLFGGRDEPVAAAAPGAIVDARVLIDQLTDAKIEPALRGVILVAKGLSPTQGYARAALLPRNKGLPDENGIVTFEFRVEPPPTLQPAGPQRTREATAAVFIQDADLADIRGFQVVAARNTLSVRR